MKKARKDKGWKEQFENNNLPKWDIFKIAESGEGSLTETLANRLLLTKWDVEILVLCSNAMKTLCKKSGLHVQ